MDTINNIHESPRHLFPDNYSKLRNMLISSAQSVSSGVSSITGISLKTLVFHKTFEEIQADKPLADTVVTVYTATQRFFRIVQVYGAQKTEANGLIEFV